MPNTLIVPLVSGLVILCFSILWLLKQFGDWVRDPTNIEFPFEPLIASISSLIVLIITPNLEGKDLWVSWIIFITALIVLIWLMPKLTSINLQLRTLLIIAFTFVNILLFWKYDGVNIRGETIKVMLQTEKGETIDNFATRTWEDQIAKKFQEKFGVKVVIEDVKNDVSKRLEQFKEELNRDNNSAVDEVDVFAIDVIWPGILEQYAEDLEPIFGKYSNQFNSAIFDNNKVKTINGSKLVAIPWYIDAGLLYYRKDLLKRYFNNDKPPITWDELEEKAKIIQKKEQEHTKNFSGFVWQGKESEGLTCNALEWQVSHAGGEIVKKSQENNFVDIDIKATTKAFERARNWIGTISPENTTRLDGRKIFQIWKKGNAAFMRNWLYAYNESLEDNGADPPLTKEMMGLTLLPKGDGDKARHASTLGGWQLMVNKHSPKKQKKAAIEFIKFLISRDVQESLTSETGKVPALKELYRTRRVVEMLPFINPNSDNSLLKNFFFKGESDVIVRRPSTNTGKKYPELSEIYFEKVHQILRKDEGITETVVKELKDKIKQELEG